jgi:predicted phage terminase large subunit-like protein
MKSLLTSVFFPSYWWLHRPENRFLAVAKSDSLATRDSRRMRDVIVSDRYQRILHEHKQGWGLAADQNQKVNFVNTQKGFRQCFPLGANFTGERGDGVIIDDPHDAHEIVLGSPTQVAARMEETAALIDIALSNRVNDLRTAWKVLTMQRLHESDTAGRWSTRPGVRVVCLPMEYEPNHPLRYDRDWRKTEGELLFPERFPAEVVAALKVQYGRHYAGQYQQRPSPAEGGMFHRDWLRTYRLLPQVSHQAISVDCAFRDSAQSDFVVMQCWGRLGSDFYLIDQVRGRMDYPATKAALRAFCAKHPKAALKLVEAKANGDALLADMQHEIAGLVGYDPKASKEARASIAAACCEAGNVHVPEGAPFVSDFIEELASFPAGAHDDQVDAMSQMLIRWTQDVPTLTPTRWSDLRR